MGRNSKRKAQNRSLQAPRKRKRSDVPQYTTSAPNLSQTDEPDSDSSVIFVGFVNLPNQLKDDNGNAVPRTSLASDHKQPVVECGEELVEIFKNVSYMQANHRQTEEDTEGSGSSQYFSCEEDLPQCSVSRDLLDLIGQNQPGSSAQLEQ